MTSAVVLLRQPFGRLAVAARRLDRFVNRPTLIVCNLSPADSRSLAAALSAAAIVVETDQSSGDLRIRHSQNRMFRPDHFTTVIEEWQLEHEQRQLVVSVEE